MRYHIVGIAGAGMSAIANILLDQGHHISGSDRQSNQVTSALARRGATLYVGHDPTYIDGTDAVIVTSAVRGNHPEVEAARAAGIPVLKRVDVWRDWSQRRAVIAIAGTHGKTTTTAMIAFVLSQAGLQPGFLVGSHVPDLGTNARWGDPAAPLIIEADEYDYTFLALSPQIAVITNAEWDHPDVYSTEDAYYAAFNQFIAQVQTTVLVCGDVGSGSERLAWHMLSGQRLTYGLEATNDYQAVLAEAGQRWSVFRHAYAPDRRHHVPATPVAQSCELTLPGLHNVRNALAALCVADILGIDRSCAVNALRVFRGTARRFELKGEVAGITVIDDYAHHPTEVRATLMAARMRYGSRRLVVYLQPHTYSRTHTLLDRWSEAFSAADLVLIGDIYGARETQATSVTHANLARHLAERVAVAHADGPRPARVLYAGGVLEAARLAQTLLEPGDVFLTLGAGDGDQVGMTILEILRSEL